MGVLLFNQQGSGSMLQPSMLCHRQSAEKHSWMGLHSGTCNHPVGWSISVIKKAAPSNTTSGWGGGWGWGVGGQSISAFAKCVGPVEKMAEGET